jgi:hypothetical protein
VKPGVLGVSEGRNRGRRGQVGSHANSLFPKGKRVELNLL